MDVVYAALIEPFGPEERARIDADLVLPLGVTGEQLEAAQRDWMRAQGW